MKVRRSLLFLATSFAVALGGCGNQEPNTALTIRVENGLGGRTYELRCDPPGGSAPQPERLCAALADHPQDLLFSATNAVCIGGFTTPHIRISGQYKGQPVSILDACGHPKAGLWYKLLPPPPSI
jgi:hypothetical protein